MGAKAKRIKLTDADRKTLQIMSSSRTIELRMAQRAKIILAAADSEPLAEISKQVGLSVNTCLEWRKRFAEEGLEALSDKPGRGRHKSITQDERLKVQALACTIPTDGSSHWSMRKLAKATGHSVSAIYTILHEGDLKPHKVHYWCGNSLDPEFEAKQAEIIGLYMNPPENALVVCVDEKSQIQALDRTEPMLPLCSGHPKRLTATYTRHGTACLLAAFSVHDGTVDGRCVDSTNHEIFLSFLKHIYRSNPRREIHVIADNLSAHKQKDVIDWISKRRRLFIHFTPTHASWLNQIEIWFNIFSRAVLKGGVWKSRQALIDQIMTFIRSYNENSAHPFAWTYEGKPLSK